MSGTGRSAWLMALLGVWMGCNSITEVEPGEPIGTGGSGGTGGISGTGGTGGSGGSGGSGGAGAAGGAGGGPDVCAPGETSQAPDLTAPGEGETLAGPTVTLSWSGGEPPYEVEVAFDAAFTEPVPGVSPITTDETSVTVAGLNGGYFHWRVRSLGGCAPSEPSAAREVHVTCSPLNLTAATDIDIAAGGLAWNPSDREYGVIMAGGSPYELYFARTDVLGNLVFGPTKITGPTLPPLSTGGYTSPSLEYVSSMDRWVTVFHREGDDQAYAMLFDDAAAEVATWELADGSDSEVQSVAYFEALDRIVTSNDVGGSVWNTAIHLFDSSLNLVGGPIDATEGAAFPYNGTYGSMIVLPDPGSNSYHALLQFQYRASASPTVQHQMLQRIDLLTGALVWPKGTSFAPIAGKVLVPNLNCNVYANMAWAPQPKVVGYTYTDDPNCSFDSTNDAFFLALDPITGTALSASTPLNTGAPLHAVQGPPKVAWDGEEFLVVWIDTRDPAVFRQLRMTKLSALGAKSGAGDVLYEHPGWASSTSAKSVIGRNRIHVMIYTHQTTQAEPRDTWLCIEPAYP